MQNKFIEKYMRKFSLKAKKSNKIKNSTSKKLISNLSNQTSSKSKQFKKKIIILKLFTA